MVIWRREVVDECRLRGWRLQLLSVVIGIWSEFIAGVLRPQSLVVVENEAIAVRLTSEGVES